MVGTRVGPYHIVGEIGAGGMGVVYRADDTRLGRPVALKFLSPTLAPDALAMARLEREARTASALNHPNICVVHEIGDHQGRPFIVMEYLDGEPLDRLIGGCPLDLRRLLDLGPRRAKSIPSSPPPSVSNKAALASV